MASGIKKAIKKARAKALADIKNNSAGFYGSGIASEGFAGGYAECLSDVEAALNGWTNSRSRYWPKETF